MVNQAERMNPHTLAPLVAAALTERTGEVWQAQRTKPDASQAVIIAAGDRATITLEPAREPGRLLMVGSFWIDGEDWRQDRHDRDHEHRRSTSGSRTPAQIAAAIVAHLLPPYRAELAEVRERRTKRLTGRMWEEQTARELAAVAGGRLHVNQHNTFQRDGIHGRVSEGYGVKLTLDWVEPNVARQIIELVRAARTASEATT